MGLKNNISKSKGLTRPAVLRPLSKRQQQVLKEVRNNEIAAHKRAVAIAAKKKDKQRAAKKSLISRRISKGKIEDSSYTRSHMRKMSAKKSYMSKRALKRKRSNMYRKRNAAKIFSMQKEKNRRNNIDIITFFFGEPLTKAEREFIPISEQRRIYRHKRMVTLDEKQYEKELRMRNALKAIKIKRGEVSDLAYTRQHMRQLADRYAKLGMRREHHEKLDAIHHAAVLRRANKHRGNLESRKRSIFARRAALKREQQQLYELWLRQYNSKEAMFRRKELEKENKINRQKGYRTRNKQNKRDNNLRSRLLRRSLLKIEQDASYNTWLRQLAAKKAAIRRKELAEMKKTESGKRSKQIVKGIKENKKESNMRYSKFRKALLAREQEKYYNTWLRQLAAKRAAMRRKELEKQKMKQAEVLVFKRKELAEAKKTAHYEKVAVSKPFTEVPFGRVFKNKSSFIEDIQNQAIGLEISRQSLKREQNKSYDIWLRHIASRKAAARKRELEEMKKREAAIRSKKRQESIKRKILEARHAALEKERLKIKEHHDSKFAYRKRRLKELKGERAEKQKEIKRNVFNVFKKKQRKKRIEDIKTKEDIKDYIKV